MEEELRGYIKKLSAKSMKSYNVLLALLAVLNIIVALVGGFVWVWGLAAFSGFLILLLYLIEHSRRESGRTSIWALFGQLDAGQKLGLLEQFRKASKEHWKSGFFASPEITIFTNSHGVYAIPSAEILWVYKKADIFFPFFRFCSIYMYTKQGEKHVCEVGMSPIWGGREKDDAASNAIWRLCCHYPGILEGYSRELYRLYSGSLAKMREIYEQRAQKG